jgi:hypothetical protein
MPETAKNNCSADQPKKCGVDWSLIIQFLIWLSATAAAGFTGYLAYIANDTEQRQLRAYVYASPYRAFHIDNLGGVVQVYTVIGSNGSTFAKKVERWVGISLLPGPVPEKFEDLGSLKREEGVLVLAPGAKSIVVQNFRKITEEELAKIMTANGELRIYVFGKITYEDAFGTPHQTTFCHAYFGSERLEFNGGFAYEDWQAKSCDRHNDAD